MSDAARELGTGLVEAAELCEKVAAHARQEVVAVETLASLLPGLEFGVDAQGRHNDGSFMLAIDPGVFMPLADFKRQVESFVLYLKETPAAEGFDEVLYPGEKEHRTEQQRRRDGIPIEDDT